MFMHVYTIVYAREAKYRGGYIFKCVYVCLSIYESTYIHIYEYKHRHNIFMSAYAQGQQIQKEDT